MKLKTPTATDIRAMLSVIPPHPDYATWIRIASAVWSVLPMAEGCRVLNSWSPEEKQGEYATKHKTRLQQVGIGTLIYYAKQYGYAPHPATRSQRPQARPALTFRPPPTLPPAPTPPTPCAAPAAPHEPNRADPRLVAHTAEQLRRIHKAGWITGTDDPNTRFFAEVIMMFEATPIFEK